MKAVPGESALLARLGFRVPQRTLRELPGGWSSDPRWRRLLAGAGVLADPGQAALRAAVAERALGGAPGFTVMAMGKYGGRELNYASDIDVLFVTNEHEGAEAVARSVMSAMNGPPTIFRMDADLRPEGKDGPLARSLDAYAAYYRRWAQVWEFQALIKCRFAAGDPEGGAAFLGRVRPTIISNSLVL